MTHEHAVDLCFVLVGILIGSLIGAVVLKLSCVLYNKMEGDSGVPNPPIERAACIVFFAVLVNAVLSFIVYRVLRLAGPSVNPTLFYLISLPLGFLVLGGANTALLPTTFNKGLLIALLFTLFSILLGAVALAIALVFGLSTSWLH